MRKFFKVRDKGKGRKSRFTFEIYHEYPEVGPVGTSGRGPYCIAWIDATSKTIESYRHELSARNYVEA